MSDNKQGIDIDIQYGILIIGLIVLIFQLYIAYQNYSKSCVVDTTSHFKPTPPIQKPVTKKRTGNLTEKDLEGFVSTPGAETTHYDPITMSLEKSVFDSHKQYADDAYITSVGPSAAVSVRDDTNEINPRWGLRRVDYTSAQSGSDARIVSSETGDQMEQANVGTYTL